MKNTSQTLVAEFKETDDNINLEFELLENRFQTIGTIESKELINAINECPNGVFEMSENIEGLVETLPNSAAGPYGDLRTLTSHPEVSLSFETRCCAAVGLPLLVMKAAGNAAAVCGGTHTCNCWPAIALCAAPRFRRFDPGRHCLETWHRQTAA